jgi:hypothetical protein
MKIIGVRIGHSRARQSRRVLVGADARDPMLLFLVKAFSSVFWNLTSGVCWGGGHDRDGPLRVGGQAPMRSRGQRGKGDPERPADRIKASTGAAADLRARPLRKL